MGNEASKKPIVVATVPADDVIRTEAINIVDDTTDIPVDSPTDSPTESIQPFNMIPEDVQPFNVASDPEEPEEVTQPFNVAPQAHPFFKNSVAPAPVRTHPFFRKKPTYEHPFTGLLRRDVSDQDMIDLMGAYIGRNQISVDTAGNVIYEVIDQTEFIGPVLEVLSFCASNGRTPVIRWLMQIFVPLQVSHDNNFCYFESVKYLHNDTADLIATHDSFIPTMPVLDDLLRRGRDTLFCKCLHYPNVDPDIRTYRFTFDHYQKANQRSKMLTLWDLFKRSRVMKVTIPDPIYAEPLKPRQVCTKPKVDPLDLELLHNPILRPYAAELRELAEDPIDFD